MAQSRWYVAFSTPGGVFGYTPPGSSVLIGEENLSSDYAIYGVCASSQPADLAGRSWAIYADGYAACSGIGDAMGLIFDYIGVDPTCSGGIAFVLICGGVYYPESAGRQGTSVKIKRGTTSYIWLAFIVDEGSDKLDGLTGLLYSDVTIKYIRNGDSSPTTTTAVTMTAGTWASGGFVEVSGMPGWYEIGIPNAAFSSGGCVAIQVIPNPSSGSKGVPINLFAELDSVDYQDGGAFGLLDLQRSVGRGSVTTGSSTTNVKIGTISPALSVANQIKGRVIIFDAATTTAGLRAQAAEITASDTSGNLTVSTLTTTPASVDTFLIV